MKKNKLLKHLFICICIIIISIIVEIFVFHFSFFSLDTSLRNSYEIDEYNKYNNEQGTIIDILLNDEYVNKLKIIYNTDKDVKYVITYSENDYYGKDKETIFNDTFDNETDIAIINFDNRISKISITFPDDNNLIIKNIIVDNSFNFNYFRFLFLFFSLLLIYLLFCFFKDGFNTKKLHIYFFVTSLLVGTILIILQPSTTYYSWDDQIHFKNVNELASGDAVWNIGEFSMIDTSPIGRDSINSLEEQEKQFDYLNSTDKGNYNSYGGRFVTYSSIAYIPSAIGFRISRLIRIPFSISFKIGKWFNLVFYLLIVSYAIKIALFNKRLVTVIGMIPTSLFLASQYSYDGAVTSGILLGVVMLMNWFIDKQFKVDFKNLLIFITAILYGCFPKAVYIPLILLFLVVPKDRFKNKKQSFIVKFGIVLIFIGMMSTFVLPTISSNDIAGDSRGGNTSVSEQLRLVVNHPIGYANVLKDTMISNFATDFFGKDILVNFGYITSNYKSSYITNNISEIDEFYLGNNLYYLFLILLLFVIFVDDDNVKFNILQKFFGIVLIFGIVLLIWTAMYLSFTPVGLNTINGVQPRYFIPLLLLLGLCIKSGKVNHKLNDKVYNFFVIFIPNFVMLVMIYQYVLKFYCL